MYCLDSYALWEIQANNPKFAKFTSTDFVVTDWTLIEYYKGLLKNFDKQTADYWFNRLKPYSKPVELTILVRAVLFQHLNKKSNMSLFDAVGYMFSLENGLKFVTGDKEFENREGVLYIKK